MYISLSHLGLTSVKKFKLFLFEIETEDFLTILLSILTNTNEVMCSRQHTVLKRKQEQDYVSYNIFFKKQPFNYTPPKMLLREFNSAMHHGIQTVHISISCINCKISMNFKNMWWIRNGISLGEKEKKTLIGEIFL